MSLQKRHSTRNRIKDIAKRGNVYSPSTEKHTVAPIWGLLVF